MKHRRDLWWRTAALVVGLLPAVLMVTADPPSGLSTAGLRSLAVAYVALLLWLFAPIPLAATGLLAIVMLPALGVIEQDRAYAFFGNSAVFFLLGVFILTGALIRTGLSKRAALLFLSRVGAGPGRLLSGVMVLCAFLALLMPEHAVAAMAYPVVLEITRSLGLRPGRSRFGTALFLALAWGAIAGGVGTLLGGARAPLALEISRQLGADQISFMDWAAAAVPISVVVTAAGFLLLRWIYRPEIDSVDSARRVLSDELGRIGRMRPVEWRAGLLVVACVALWMTLGDELGLALISVGAAVAVFALRLARWGEIVEYVNWNVIVMYGGAIALGKALVETGAVVWLSERMTSVLGLSAQGAPAFFSALALVLSQGISNAAAVVVVLPMGLGFAEAGGTDTFLVTIAVATAAGFAFCFPVSTPANAIVHDSGHVRTRQMAAGGLVMAALGWAVLLLAARFYWPLLPWMR